MDISALPKHVWLPRLKKANVLVVGGGDSSHLIKCIVSSGLKNEFSTLLKNRIYVGISAGSNVTNKTIQASYKFIFSKKKAPKSLGLVDFYTRPHSNSLKFPKCSDKNLKKAAGKFDGDIYAIDDDSAVLVDGDKIKVISEGKWKIYRKNIKQ